MKDRWEEGPRVRRLSITSINLSSAIAQVYYQRACSINRAVADSPLLVAIYYSCIFRLSRLPSELQETEIDSPSYDTSEIRTSGGPTYGSVLFKERTDKGSLAMLRYT
jgi:hypothetical protein